MPVVTRNKNRFRKVYPGTRKSAVDESLYPTKIEAGIITLSDSNEGEYVFSYGYASVPAVIATVVDTTGEANTNVIVSAVTTSKVTVQTSANITGNIHVQVVEVSS